MAWGFKKVIPVTFATLFKIDIHSNTSVNFNFHRCGWAAESSSLISCRTRKTVPEVRILSSPHNCRRGNIQFRNRNRMFPLMVLFQFLFCHRIPTQNEIYNPSEIKMLHFRCISHVNSSKTPAIIGQELVPAGSQQVQNMPAFRLAFLFLCMSHKSSLLMANTQKQKRLAFASRSR